jgi:hypothetical protein
LHPHTLKRAVLNCTRYFGDKFRGDRAESKFRQLVSGFASGHVGFVVDRVALWRVFSEYFDFLCKFSFQPGPVQ